MIDTYPILNSKINVKYWKLYHLMDYHNYVNRHLFKPKTDMLKSIYQIHVLFMTQTYINNLKIDENAVFKYIAELDKLADKSDSEEYKKKIDNLQSLLLNFIDNYIIDNKFYPIVTMNETQGRLFINPIYSWNLKYINNLFIRFGFIVPPKNKKCIYFDVNGLTLRGLCYYIYTETKDCFFKNLSNYPGDIYEYLFINTGANKIINKKSYNRDSFKIGLIAYLFGKQDKFFDILYNSSDLIKVIKNYANSLGHDLISQYSVLWLSTIIYKCLISLENSYINIPFINYDGGYIVISKRTYNSINKNFPFLRLSEW